MILRTIGAVLGASAMLVATAAPAMVPDPDPGKKACVQEARRLCPAEMKSLSRKKVEACMIAKIDQTSPTCHAAMLRIKAQREDAAKR
ncbi:hypothetical protein [Sphingomonas sp. R1]|uniref:hypothetical protein n=1 Tax=Sphingomonas sp. R1 TaxID=399176 RepID=UPI0022252C85|nr:hypothetical protein [Sphingomonas sp. R1]UYY79475.1 hypothetical protein OIM94_18610 [Sphingomonas sp. R1]